MGFLVQQTVQYYLTDPVAYMNLIKPRRRVIILDFTGHPKLTLDSD